MNIEYGREFIELARCLNFTEAAGNLNITQPALSKHVLSLEKEFGIDLLDRDRKGLQLTEAGRILFENASAMVEAYDRTKRSIDLIKSMRPINVIGCMDDSDVSALMSMTTMIARETRRATVVFNRSVGDPIELVESGACDVLIEYVSPTDMQERGLRCRPFTAAPLIAIVGLNHPLATASEITWEDLRDQTLLKFTSDVTETSWNQISAACSAHGFKPKTRQVSACNNVEFFGTPLRGDVLLWKRTEKQVGLLLETGCRAGVPLVGELSELTSYLVYRPENEQRLQPLFESVNDVRKMLDERKAAKRTQ